MTIEQNVAGKLTTWPPDTTATRDLDEDYARMVFGVSIFDLAKSGVDCLILSALWPVSREAFDWDAAEKRADWEQKHGRFIEFDNVKDLLSNLHS
jgi:hypothetical protein